MNSKTTCKRCKKETIYQNYCMPCTFDLKEIVEEENQIKIKTNEQLMLFAIQTVKSEKEEHKKELVAQMAKETYVPITSLTPKIERIVRTKDIHALIKDLGFEKDVIYTKKKEKCIICETEQDFKEEPIIGCVACEGQLEEILAEEQKILLKKDKDDYKRLAYLQTDCYKSNGKLSKKGKELSYLWFGEIFEKENIDQRIKDYEKSTKRPLKQLQSNIAELKKEKEKKEEKENCHVCKNEKEVHIQLFENSLLICKSCEEQIKSKLNGKMMDENSQEYKNIVMHYYIHEVFEKDSVTPIIYKNIKENAKRFNIMFETIDELKEKNKQFIEALENIRETVVFKVSGQKNKKEKIIGLKPLKENIKEVLAFEEWQEKRKEKGLKTIKQNLSTFFIGKKGMGKTTGINFFKEVMIEKGLAEDVEPIIIKKEVLDHDNAERHVAYLLAQVGDAFVFVEEADVFVATVKGQKVLNLLATKIEENNVHVLLSVETKNKADLINKHMYYKASKKIVFKEYEEKEFVQLFERIVEEQEYVISNYARTVLRENIKKKPKTKTYADYLFSQMVQNMVKRENNRKKPNVHLLTKQDMQAAMS